MLYCKSFNVLFIHCSTSDITLIVFFSFEFWYIIPIVLLITTLTGKSIGTRDRSLSFEISYGAIEIGIVDAGNEHQEPKSDQFSSQEITHKKVHHRVYGTPNQSRPPSTKEAGPMNIHGLDRFVSPDSLEPSTSWLLSLGHGSVFDRSDGPEGLIRPPENPSSAAASADKADYYSRRGRGESFDHLSFSVSPKADLLSSMMNPTPTSHDQQNLSSSSLFRYQFSLIWTLPINHSSNL